MKERKRHRRRAWSYRALEEVPVGLVGVYAFWCRQNGKCVYVGKASEQSVGQRLRQHWRRSHNRQLRLWLQVFGDQLDMCYAAADQDKIATLERRLIRLWNPEANVQHRR